MASNSAKRKYEVEPSDTTHRKRLRTLKEELRNVAEALQLSLHHIEQQYRTIDIPFGSQFVALRHVTGKTLAGQLYSMEDYLKILDVPVKPPSEFQETHEAAYIISSMLNTVNVEREILAKTYRSVLDLPPGQSDREETIPFRQDRRKAIQDGISAPSPSEAAKQFMSEQNAHPMQIGRPFERTGPPIFIFHTVFSKFMARINSKKPDLEAGDEATALRLVQAAAKGYKSEALRLEAILPEIEKLLGSSIGGTASDYGFRPDGVIFHQVPGMKGKVPILVVEAKNEVGTGGSDPSIQGAYSFRKLWIHVPEFIRNASCSPSFVLSVAGPQLAIHGGIFTNGFIVQPLTEILSLVNFPNFYKRSRYIAQVMVALRECLDDLKKFYNNLNSSPAAEPEAYAPTFRQYADVTLTYTSMDLLSDRMGRSMFDAMATRSGEQEATPVKVKFTSQYCRKAHDLLAERNLAPRLRYYGELEDGWVVVVMDAAGQDLESAKPSPIPERVLGDIKDALALLHGENLVFGDLRPPNILLCDRVRDDGETEQGAMLVDFDWVGEHGKQRYPLLLNRGVRWPGDVEGGKVLKKEHDNEMLELLRL